MKVTDAVIFALVASSPLWVAAQDSARQDGRWEVTVEMEMPGMPMKMSMAAGQTIVMKHSGKRLGDCTK